MYLFKVIQKKEEEIKIKIKIIHSFIRKKGEKRKKKVFIKHKTFKQNNKTIIILTSKKKVFFKKKSLQQNQHHHHHFLSAFIFFPFFFFFHFLKEVVLLVRLCRGAEVHPLLGLLLIELLPPLLLCQVLPLGLSLPLRLHRIHRVPVLLHLLLEL